MNQHKMMKERMENEWFTYKHTMFTNKTKVYYNNEKKGSVNKQLQTITNVLTSNTMNLMICDRVTKINERL